MKIRMHRKVKMFFLRKLIKFENFLFKRLIKKEARRPFYLGLGGGTVFMVIGFIALFISTWDLVLAACAVGVSIIALTFANVDI
jgi:hypothetical protein